MPVGSEKVLPDSVVICERFFSPQHNWLTCDDDGGIDIDVFTRRLASASSAGST